MKIKKMEIYNPETNEVVNKFILGEKPLFLFGKNQSGKTTALQFIEWILGFQLMNIKGAMNKEETKNLLSRFTIDVEGKERTLTRNFTEKAYDKNGNYIPDKKRHSHSTSVREEGIELGSTFFDVWNSHSPIKLPKIMNISSLNSLNTTDRSKVIRDIQITDYGRIFNYVQNPEKVLGSHMYSNQATVMLTIASMTGSVNNDDYQSIIDHYINRENASKIKSIKKMMEFSMENFSQPEKDALKLYASTQSELHDENLKKMKSEIKRLQMRISIRNSSNTEARNELGSLENYIDSFKFVSEISDILKKTLMMDISSPTAKRVVELKELINYREEENKKDISFLNDIKKTYMNRYEEISKKLSINDNDKDNLISKAIANKILNKKNDNDFNLTKELKKIETKYINKFKLRLNKIIDEIVDMEKFKSVNEGDKEKFIDLKKANFYYFSNTPIDGDEYISQGSLIDIYNLIRILVNAELSISHLGRIPFLIVDTPLRNEEVGFYRNVIQILIEKIFKLSKEIDILAFATADKDLPKKLFNLPSNKYLASSSKGITEKMEKVEKWNDEWKGIWK